MQKMPRFIIPPSLLTSKWNICIARGLRTMILTSCVLSARATAAMGTITDDFPCPMFSCMTEFDPEEGDTISLQI
jgi:hypothetical protein